MQDDDDDDKDNGGGLECPVCSSISCSRHQKTKLNSSDVAMVTEREREGESEDRERNGNDLFSL